MTTQLTRWYTCKPNSSISGPYLEETAVQCLNDLMASCHYGFEVYDSRLVLRRVPEPIVVVSSLFSRLGCSMPA